MKILKKIPIEYKGELHDVRLINFSVEMEEVIDRVPEQIKVRDFGGRALISMVDVDLKRMRPTFAPEWLHFNYRHVAFRLLVEDAAYNADGQNRGIFFWQSFTNQSLMVAGGSMLTDYRLTRAEFAPQSDGLMVRKGEHLISYELDFHREIEADAELLKTVGAIDRAYSVLGNDVRVTQIMREKWPLEPVHCKHFRNTFFQTTRLEGVFRVPEIIYYRWQPPRVVEPLSETIELQRA